MMLALVGEGVLLSDELANTQSQERLREVCTLSCSVILASTALFLWGMLVGGGVEE